ncbi:MAG: hypothetical protein M3067_02120 [Chloroflexota bacterium]|nr:hypothetical protein [Chloroflexota bacterium]
MMTVDCPWCEEPIRTEAHADVLRCDGCRIELQLAPDDEALDIARAA